MQAKNLPAVGRGGFIQLINYFLITIMEVAMKDRFVKLFMHLLAL